MFNLMTHSTHFICLWHLVMNHSDSERKPEAAITWATLSN